MISSGDSAKREVSGPATGCDVEWRRCKSRLSARMAMWRMALETWTGLIGCRAQSAPREATDTAADREGARQQSAPILCASSSIRPFRQMVTRRGCLIGDTSRGLSLVASLTCALARGTSADLVTTPPNTDQFRTSATCVEKGRSRWATFN